MKVSKMVLIMLERARSSRLLWIQNDITAMHSFSICAESFGVSNDQKMICWSKFDFFVQLGPIKVKISVVLFIGFIILKMLGSSKGFQRETPF